MKFLKSILILPLIFITLTLVDNFRSQARDKNAEKGKICYSKSIITTSFVTNEAAGIFLNNFYQDYNLRQLMTKGNSFKIDFEKSNDSKFKIFYIFFNDINFVKNNNNNKETSCENFQAKLTNTLNNIKLSSYKDYEEFLYEANIVATLTSTKYENYFYDLLLFKNNKGTNLVNLPIKFCPFDTICSNEEEKIPKYLKNVLNAFLTFAIFFAFIFTKKIFYKNFIELKNLFKKKL